MSTEVVQPGTKAETYLGFALCCLLLRLILPCDWRVAAGFFLFSLGFTFGVFVTRKAGEVREFVEEEWRESTQFFTPERRRVLGTTPGAPSAPRPTRLFVEEGGVLRPLAGFADFPQILEPVAGQ